MIVEKVQHSIKTDQKNLVFYFDADGSVKEELPAIKEAGIKVIEVKSNFFQLKYQLEYELSGEQVFVYHNYSKPNDTELKKYPLLDLLKANTELRLDDISEFLAQFQLPDHMESFIKPYIKQLKTKTNQKKLAKILDAQHLTEDTLKLGLISLALDFNTVVSKNECLAKLLIISQDTKSFEKAIKTLNELELADVIQKWIKLLTNESGELTLDFIKQVACKLKYNYLTQLIDHTVKEDDYAKLKLNNSSDINRIQAFFNDWKENKTLAGSLDDVLNEVAFSVDSLKVLSWYGTQADYGYYSDQMVSEIIQGFYFNVQKSPQQISEECTKWLRPNFTTGVNYLQIQFIDYVART